MFHVEIVAIGKLSQDFLKNGEKEYLERIKPYYDIKVIELSEYKLEINNRSDIKKALEAEGKRILNYLKIKKYPIIVLAIEGKEMSSKIFAENLRNLSNKQPGCIFIVGASYGLSEEVKREANSLISLSQMTFPHQLSRVILLEQIYRAATINVGITYHK